MSHEIEIVNGKASTAYFGKAGWTGLGNPLTNEDRYSVDATLVKSGLNWDVSLVPLMTADTLMTVDHFAVRRSTDGKILGTVGPKYHVVQNTAALGWFQPFLDAREAGFDTAGSLRGGSRIWALAKLSRPPIEVAPGDTVDKYLLLSHGHDGSLAVRVGFTPVRVVCANTLAMAHGSDASQLIRIKHSKSVLDNLEAVRETINVANERFEATAEQYRRLATRHISRADVRAYVYQVLEIEDEDKASTRKKNIAQAMIDLYEGGRGNDLPSIRGTLWAAYNGVNEYLAYNRGSNQENRLDSLWFGDSSAMNTRALETALAMAV